MRHDAEPSRHQRQRIDGIAGKKDWQGEHLTDSHEAFPCSHDTGNDQRQRGEQCRAEHDGRGNTKNARGIEIDADRSAMLPGGAACSPDIAIVLSDFISRPKQPNKDVVQRCVGRNPGSPGINNSSFGCLVYRRTGVAETPIIQPIADLRMGRAAKFGKCPLALTNCRARARLSRPVSPKAAALASMRPRPNKTKQNKTTHNPGAREPRGMQACLPPNFRAYR